MLVEILKKQLLNAKTIICFVVCLLLFGVAIFSGITPNVVYQDALVEFFPSGYTAADKIKILKEIALNVPLDDKYYEVFDEKYREYVDIHAYSDEKILENFREDGYSVSLKEVGKLKYNPEYYPFVFPKNPGEDHYESTMMLRFWFSHQLELYSFTDVDGMISDEIRWFEMLGYSKAWIAAAVEHMHKQFDDNLIYDGYKLGYSIYTGSHMFLTTTLGLFLVFCTYNIFSDDRKTRVINIVGASKRRKQLFVSKIAAIILISVGAFAIFEVTNYLICSSYFGMGDASATAITLSRTTLDHLSVFSQASLTTITNLFGAIVTGLVLSLLSSKFGNKSSFVLGVLWVLTTFLLSYNIRYFLTDKGMHMLNPVSLLGNIYGYGSYAYVLLFGIFTPLILVSIVIGIVSIVIAIIVNKRSFNKSIS